MQVPNDIIEWLQLQNKKSSIVLNTSKHEVGSIISEETRTAKNNYRWMSSYDSAGRVYHYNCYVPKIYSDKIDKRKKNHHRKQ